MFKIIDKKNSNLTSKIILMENSKKENDQIPNQEMTYVREESRVLSQQLKSTLEELSENMNHKNGLNLITSKIKNIISLLKKASSFIFFGFYTYEKEVYFRNKYRSINDFRLFIHKSNYGWEDILVSIIDNNYSTSYKKMDESWIDDELNLPKFEINLSRLNFPKESLPNEIRLDVNIDGLIKKIKLKGQPFAHDLFICAFITFNFPMFYGYNFFSLINCFWIILFFSYRLYIILKVQYELKIKIIDLQNLSHVRHLESKHLVESMNNKQSNFDPNAPETEEDGLVSGKLRQLKARNQFPNRSDISPQR